MIVSGIGASAPVLGTEQVFGAETRTLGSSTAITAVLARRLGLRVALISKVGDDADGRFCVRALAAEGVETAAIRVAPGEATGVTLALAYPTDRLLLTRYGTMETFGPDDIDAAALARTRHVHIGSLFLQPRLRAALPALLTQARAHGATVSLDPGWDPAEAWDPPALDVILPLTDVFLPNLTELRAIAGTADIDAALVRLGGRGAREIAVKLGADGGLVWHAGQVTRHPGFPVTPVDTTGAGDAFNAGYLCARLQGADATGRLRLANACGAVTTTAAGGTTALRSRQDAERLIASAP